MDNYTHINYRTKPYFNTEKLDEWCEKGCFYSKGKYFLYSNDRRNSNYQVDLIAETKQEFKSYCNTNQIKIPIIFWSALKRMQ